MIFETLLNGIKYERISIIYVLFDINVANKRARYVRNRSQPVMTVYITFLLRYYALEIIWTIGSIHKLDCCIIVTNSHIKIWVYWNVNTKWIQYWQLSFCLMEIENLKLLPKTNIISELSSRRWIKNWIL